MSAFEVKTIEQLRTLIASRRHFATEHHLSGADFDALVTALRGTGLMGLDPNCHKRHFLFEGARVVRTWEP